MKAKIWIVTREENQYDQMGEYFVVAFLSEPSLDQLRAIAPLDSAVKMLKDGGGRIGVQDTWYNLRKVEEGKISWHE